MKIDSKLETRWNSGCDKLPIEVVADMVEMICIDVVKEAVSMAPALTGDLKRSIDYKIDPKAKYTVIGYVGSPLDYAIYQEFGTRYMRPQPFLRPAIAVATGSSTAQQALKNKAEETAKGNLRESKDRVKFF